MTMDGALDVSAQHSRAWTADKYRLTRIQITRDSAYVEWEKGYLDGTGEFVPVLDFNVHIEDDDEHADFSRFLQLAEVSGLITPIQSFTSSQSTAEEWLTTLRNVMDSRGITA